jgi:hypothetical protein
VLANCTFLQPRVLTALHMLVISFVTEALVVRLRCEPDVELPMTLLPGEHCLELC